MHVPIYYIIYMKQRKTDNCEHPWEEVKEGSQDILFVVHNRGGPNYIHDQSYINSPGGGTYNYPEGWGRMINMQCNIIRFT